MSQAAKTKPEAKADAKSAKSDPKNPLAVASSLTEAEEVVRTALNTIDGKGRLWSLFGKYRQAQKRELTQHIDCRYEQGRLLNSAERIDNRAPRLFAESSNQSRAMIREMQLVALRMEPDEIQAFIASANSMPKPGGPKVAMGWSHLCELATVENADDRRKYLRRIKDKALSVEDLRQVLRDDGVKLYDYGVREGGGRTFALPEDPVGIMSKVSRQSSAFHRLIEQAMFDKFERAVLDTPIATIGPDGLAKLEAGYAEIAELSTMIEGRLGDISRIIDEVRQAVATGKAIESLDPPKTRSRVRIPAPGAAPSPSKAPAAKARTKK